MIGNGDYISREAAKNVLLQHQHRFTCADEANGYGSVKWSEDVIYISEAVNGMDAIPAADVRPRWISVKDALPELHNAEYLDEVTGELIRYKESKPILIWLAKGGFMDIGIYEKSDSVDDFCYQGVPATVTYWMPLPEPPKEE